LPDDTRQALALAGGLVASAADGEFGVTAARFAPVRSQIPISGHAGVALDACHARFAPALAGLQVALSADGGFAALAGRATL